MHNLSTYQLLNYVHSLAWTEVISPTLKYTILLLMVLASFMTVCCLSHYLRALCGCASTMVEHTIRPCCTGHRKVSTVDKG